VLKAAGSKAAFIVLVASDGYSVNVTVADVTDQCLLAYNTKGGVDAVMPGLAKATWARDVVEIKEGSQPSPTPRPAGSGAATAAPKAKLPGEPLKLTDAAGRTVALSGIPQRLVVVGTGPHMTLHILYMFPEGRQRLVGMEKKGATVSNFLPLVDPAFKSVPVLDANPNAEQIAALQPDLVLMKGSAADKLSETLDAAGIPSFYLALETPELFVKDVTNLGLILGNTKRAAEILAFYQTRLERLAKGVAEVKDADKPRVLLLEYSDRGGGVAVQVPARAWMQTIEVQTAGGNPVWLEAAQPTSGWTVVNFEQIARWDADKIFLVVWYTLDPQKVVNDLKADPQWSALKAVKNNQIYAFPADIFGWDQPEPRWILGMNWLATRLYPERFQDIDMNAELLAFFGDLYGMDKAAVEADILPTVKMDVR
jgi:iron complex transport system substrate-binding protein